MFKDAHALFQFIYIYAIMGVIIMCKYGNKETLDTTLLFAYNPSISGAPLVKGKNGVLLTGVMTRELVFAVQNAWVDVDRLELISAVLLTPTTAKQDASKFYTGYLNDTKKERAQGVYATEILIQLLIDNSIQNTPLIRQGNAQGDSEAFALLKETDDGRKELEWELNRDPALLDDDGNYALNVNLWELVVITHPIYLEREGENLCPSA